MDGDKKIAGNFFFVGTKEDCDAAEQQVVDFIED
jgi:hypothetical protein